jgi:signal transduction histidine kinase
LVSANQFWNSIKARQIGYAIIAVPLVTQLLVVLCLVVLLGQFEQAIRKERHAKEVMTAVNDLYLKEAMQSLFAGRQIMRNDASRFAQFSRQVNAFAQNCQVLENLVKDDGPQSNTVRAYLEHSQRILDLDEEGLHAYGGSFRRPIFARFIDASDFFMEYRWQTKLGKEAQEAVMTAYGKVVSELKPRAIKDRKNLRRILIGGLILNALVAIYMTASITYQFVARLNQLLRNIKLFSAGQLSPALVSGDDEIAKLDQSFRTIAQEKLRADQQRLLMVNTMSEDIRSPLQSISAAMEKAISGDYGELPDELQARLKRANSEVLRLLALSADLIDVDRLAHHDIELSIGDCSVNALVEQAVNAVQALADAKNITLERQVPATLKVRCDANRIVQVLVNLLSNAIKFSPRASKVSVSATDLDGKIKITVRDQGQGIPEEEKARIFEKFAQIPTTPGPEHTGAGLGLYICKALVERHGGSVGVASKIGEGSAFWIELKMAREGVK